jgi:hypothetical protein
MKMIHEYMFGIEDFRIEKKCLHKLSDILLIGLFTYLSNGEDYGDMVLFAKTHKEFLRPYVSLPSGIPSHDTFRRVFSLLSPDVLRQCLTDYGKDIIGLLAKKQICLDGKKLRVYPRQAEAIQACTSSMPGCRKTGCALDKRKGKTRATR